MPRKKPEAKRAEVIDAAARAITKGKLIGERPVTDFRAAPVKLIAIRGYYRKNRRGVYDDAIFVITEDGDFAAFNANVDPTTQFKTGRASMVANQVIWYRPGLHGISRKNPYPAFRQASVVVVVRDGGTGNGTPIGGGQFKDRPNKRFWINLHRGGKNTTSSAGCQTIPPDQWGAARDLIKLYLKRYQVAEFPYMLLDGLR